MLRTSSYEIEGKSCREWNLRFELSADDSQEINIKFQNGKIISLLTLMKFEIVWIDGEIVKDFPEVTKFL